jgi:DNA replication protein DnaC
LKINSHEENPKTINLKSAKSEKTQLQLLQLTDDDKTSRLENVSPYDLRTWPDGDVIGLNESQYKAFQSALQRELAVIQGPPGTGKTYLGLKIAHTLLDNNRLWKEANDGKSCPILMLAYTNHALDSFLEGLTIDRKGIVFIRFRAHAADYDQSKTKNNFLKTTNFMTFCK